MLVVLAGYALWSVFARAWTCDDAFITYRYAKHLVHGEGLVFNPGERVEGYTNFLFAITIAAMMALGLEPRLASILLGVIAYLVVAAILVGWSRRGAGRSNIHRIVLPLGAALWLVQDDLHTWATGGLETTVFAALVLGAFACLTRGQRNARDAVLGSLLLSLAVLTRPDGLLFAAVGIVAPFAMPPNRIARARHTALIHMSAIAIPLTVVIAVFAVFKLTYYGRLLPTAFYAKSAAAPYYSQGLVYVGLYGVKHWAMSAACVMSLAGLLVSSRLRMLMRQRHDALLALVIFVLFATYVAHSGGDYMFARRLVPALPFLFVFLDAVAALVPRVGTLASLVTLAASFFPYPLFPTDKIAYVRGITDERLQYPEELIASRRAQAHIANDIFAHANIRAAFGGGMCAFAFYSELPYLVEPNGLTQYWIAERSIKQRGMLGHEKSAPMELLRAHGVRFVFHHDLPPLAQSLPRFNEILLGRFVRVEILQYDDASMDRLARYPGVRFNPIDKVLREATSDLATMNCNDANATMQALSDLYLDRHPAAAIPLRAAMSACARK
jgi:hypothetical protein